MENEGTPTAQGQDAATQQQQQQPQADAVSGIQKRIDELVAKVHNAESRASASEATLQAFLAGQSQQTTQREDPTLAALRAAGIDPEDGDAAKALKLTQAAVNAAIAPLQQRIQELQVGLATTAVSREFTKFELTAEEAQKAEGVHRNLVAKGLNPTPEEVAGIVAGARWRAEALKARPNPQAAHNAGIAPGLTGGPPNATPKPAPDFNKMTDKQLKEWAAANGNLPL